MTRTALTNSNLSNKIEDTKPLGFFETIYEAFQQTEMNVGSSIGRFYRIGGYTVRLCFAGPALMPYITPALEHLATPPVPKSDLSICLWDSNSTQIQMPPPAWKESDYLARGVIRGYNTERFQTSFHLGSNILSMLDHSRHLAIFWIRDAEQIPFYETGAPLRAILHAWMREHGRQLTHAAAVGSQKDAVLLVGKGGSGKSTTAVACLQSKLRYVSDDYCLLSTSNTTCVYSLYNTAKLDPAMLKKFPQLLAKASNKQKFDSEKALLFINEANPEKLINELPVKAILLPRVTGRDTTAIKAASSGEALAGLAPSTIFQLPGGGPGTFRVFARLVAQVPCYTLELGTDIPQIPSVILDLLSENLKNIDPN